jgi:CRISPR/Cas system-associated exonuclease Cas4 (RecB family)
MSQYYTPKRTKGLFDPAVKEPFKISRTKIGLFSECPRCFYLDRRLGVSRPPGFPFSLNNAVDTLLKKEFDAYRAKGTPHPFMTAYGVDAVPFVSEKIDEWRDSMKAGVQCVHKPTNLLVAGGVDDVWVNPKGELIVVDYKATSKNGEVSLDAEWQDSYKRQMEVYQWLLRNNGFKVSDIGYFVYCNGKTDREAFDGKLEFDVKLIPYKGDDSWIEKTLKDIKKCLMSDSVPESSDDCDYCRYCWAVKDTK